MVLGAIGIPNGHTRRRSPRYVGAELGIIDAIKALDEAGYDIKKRDDTMVTVPRRITFTEALATAEARGMERAAVIARETYYNTSSQGQHRLAVEIATAIRKEIADG